MPSSGVTITGSPAPPLHSPSPAAAPTPGNRDAIKSQQPAVQYAFPVLGTVTYGHAHHDYPATDIMAACGTPVVAAATGSVLEVSRADRYDPKVNAGATRGGLSVSILGDDGVRYYGSHLSAVDSTINAGVRVTAGKRIGKVGQTGDAGACHLHFGISPPCAMTGDWWVRRGAIWPWPYLDSWRSGGQRSPVHEAASWQAANGCPKRALTDA
jgi:murein DD-endopeptidase MepM/ murein hydrolase activator NlpD